MSDSHFLHLRQRSTSEAVSETWIVQAARCRTAVERVLPDCTVEIYFNLGPAGRRVFDESIEGALPRRRAWVVGPHAAPLLIEKEIVDCDLVGVRLNAGTVEQLLGIPPAEIRDSVADLEDLWGATTIDLLREQLQSCAPAARLDVVDRAIRERFARFTARRENALARHLAASMMQQTSIDSLARAHGMSHRRVIELFDRHFGLKPKMLQRIRRLRRVLRHIHADQRVSWTEIAWSCGYFDQAHLINDFRDQTGITPAKYAASRSSIGRGFLPFRLAATA